MAMKPYIRKINKQRFTLYLTENTPRPLSERPNGLCFGEIVAVYYQHHSVHMNTFCGEMQRL